MKVIGTQAHWYPRALLDAYVENDGYPGCRREGDSYAVEILRGEWTPLPLHFVELRAPARDDARRRGLHETIHHGDPGIA